MHTSNVRMTIALKNCRSPSNGATSATKTHTYPNKVFARTKSVQGRNRKLPLIEKLLKLNKMIDYSANSAESRIIQPTSAENEATTRTNSIIDKL